MAAQLIQGQFPGYNRPQVSWGQSPVIWGALCYRKTSNIFLIIFQQVNISIVRFFHGPCDSVKLSWPIWHIFAPFLQTNTNLLQSGSNRTNTVCYRWGVLCLWRLYYLCNIIRFCRFMIYMCFFSVAFIRVRYLPRYGGGLTAKCPHYKCIETTVNIFKTKHSA